MLTAGLDYFPLGAPVASIGGGGTFDDIFVTGRTAVVLAALVTPAGRVTVGH